MNPFRQSKFVLRFVAEGVERRLHPGDRLVLTQTMSADMGTKRSEVSVTVTYEWDGRTLRAK